MLRWRPIRVTILRQVPSNSELKEGRSDEVALRVRGISIRLRARPVQPTHLSLNVVTTAYCRAPQVAESVASGSTLSEARVKLYFALIGSPAHTRGTSDSHMPRARHDERRLFQAGYAHRTRD
jgi:hypothetical protein